MHKYYYTFIIEAQSLLHPLLLTQKNCYSNIIDAQALLYSVLLMHKY